MPPISQLSLRDYQLGKRKITVMDQQELVELGNFKDLRQADLAQEILESNNINSFVVGNSSDFLDMRDVKEIRIKVNKNEREKAEMILDTFFPGSWR